MIAHQISVIIPIIFLFSGIFIAAFGSWIRKTAYPIAITGSALAVITALYQLFVVTVKGSISYRLGGWIPPIGIEYVLDPLSAFFNVVIVLVSFVTLVHAHRLILIELHERIVPYLSLCMLFLSGLTGIIITGDLFNLYVFIEISALAGYGILAIGEKAAPVAVFRYLLVGTIGASFYLLGVGFIYLMCGSLNMADVAKILPPLVNESTIIVAIILMVVGIGIKMAIFPMHGWLPDSYTLASSSSSTLVAPIGTKVAAYTLIRLLFFVFGIEFVRDGIPLMQIIGWLSAVGILYGSIMAIAQKELKRMLAYSSVAQIGFVGLGIGLASPLGIIGAVLHVLNHALMKSCLFMIAGNMRVGLGHSIITNFDNTISRSMPWSLAAFTVAALSMIGIPPFAGFFSKWYLVLGGIEQSNWIFVVVILISSLLNAVYFFRILEKVYIRSTTKGAESSEPIHNLEKKFSLVIPVVALAIVIILVGVFNAVIVETFIRSIFPIGT